MARGGRRTGTPGKAYGNRTDLQTGSKPLPITAVPGQPYGAAGEQIAAQQAVPMQSTPLPAMPEDMPVAPGDLPALHAPSERPDEPITHGLPIGPGGGPEVFPTAPTPVQRGMAILNTLGDQLPPELKAVARYLNLSATNGMTQ